MNLPSKFQIGEKARLFLGELGFLSCSILRIHFTESKVMYDIQVIVPHYDRLIITRFYNIDSALIFECENL